jgi:hypothetical protein
MWALLSIAAEAGVTVAKMRPELPKPAAIQNAYRCASLPAHVHYLYMSRTKAWLSACME